MEQKNLIWESYVDGSIFYDEESMREYAEENIDDIDICDAMCSFSKMEIFEALNEEKKLEILDRAVEIFIENFIKEEEEEQNSSFYFLISCS